MKNKQKIKENKEKVKPRNYLSLIVGTLTLPDGDINALAQILNEMCEEKRQQTAKQIFEEIDFKVKKAPVTRSNQRYVNIRIMNYQKLKRKWVKQ